MNRLHSQKWSQIVRVLFNDKYLLYTNLAISVASSSTGDAIQQHYEILKSSKTDQNGQSFQVHRSIHMGFSGLSVGLVCHYWYQFLDRRLIGKFFFFGPFMTSRETTILFPPFFRC